ncbi:outer membrane protein assembly factor BamB family protein [Actinomadura sediminis]|uniref:outer membrane protein assembly factor BamB family protein n=1 Tax=Actinomadura sediminis TaxID=1038904 RepID=UPI003672FE30
MLGLIAGGLAVALCVVLVDRFVLHAEWWEVRHRVTGESVAALGDVGPPPGPLAVSWERTTRVHRGPVAGYDTVSYDVAKGQVVTVSGQGVQVVDARTGARRWSYSRSDWSLLGWTSTDSRLVGYFERDGHRADRVLVGFDLLSGSLLWKREGPRPAAVSRTTLRFPAGAGVVLATDDERRTLNGLSAEDGEPLWQRPVEHGCRLFEGAAQPSGDRESLVAIALDCARRSGPSRLLALDPRTGDVRWDEVLGAEEAPEVTMLDGVTLVSDGTALRAFGEEGEEFAAWDGDAVCGDGMCPSVLVDGRLIVVYHPAGTKRGTTLMEAVDVSSGNVGWAREVPPYTALARAGGDVYALRPRLSELLLPAGIDVVSPADGTATTAPAPFTMDPDLPGGRPWIAAAGGLLYVAVAETVPRPAGESRLVALRGGRAGPGPDELGGVPVADWPDACELLEKEDLARAGLERYVTEPARAEVGTAGLPDPVSCTYEPVEKKAGGDGDPREGAEPGEGAGEGGEEGDEGAGRADGAGGTGGAEGSGEGDGDRPGTGASEGGVPPSAEASGSGSPAPGGGASPSDGPRAHPTSPPPPTGVPTPADGARATAVRGLTVSVRWVAETDEAASQMLDAFQSVQSQVRRRENLGGDEMYEIGATAGVIAVRVGRVIAVVEAGSPTGAAARLAKSVAARLEERAREAEAKRLAAERKKAQEREKAQERAREEREEAGRSVSDPPREP